MIKGKSIAGYLLILLLVLFSNGQPSYSFPATTALTAAKAVFSTSERNTKTSIPLIASTLRKEHIKVRYMGGECPFDGTSICLHVPAVVFIDQVKRGSYVSIISSTPHFLFKLRGPPVYC